MFFVQKGGYGIVFTWNGIFDVDMHECRYYHVGDVELSCPTRA